MKQFTQIVKIDQRTALHHPGGSIVELLTPPNEDAYCVMTGTIPPGATVPLHSHGDAESFYALTGNAEVLVETADRLAWQTLSPGDFVHIPGGAKHAWRNCTGETAVTLVACTAKLGRALQEMGQLAAEFAGQSLTPSAMQRLVEIAVRYGYWLGSPEENAAIGLTLPA
jgi:quercetin dioxygenase-like cupin family protein